MGIKKHGFDAYGEKVLKAEQIANHCLSKACAESIAADGMLSALLEKAKRKGGFSTFDCEKHDGAPGRKHASSHRR